MDYDENDFRSQNLQLAGEGVNEFSPVIRSYALPKFDFDDSLQGHLRFDSLVETEVFLGIESQEHSHWIEDFSRGNSGVEFSPCAAESCSISRRNNAWSEATSSESVEMLLKSVGQEEMIPGNITKESVAHDDRDDLSKQMNSLSKQTNSSLEQDDQTFPVVVDIGDLRSILPSATSLEDVPQLNEDGGSEATHVEVANKFTSSVAGVRGGLTLTVCSSLENAKCDSVDVMEVDLSDHNFPVSRDKVLSATEMPSNNMLNVGNYATSIQNVVPSIREVIDQDTSGYISNNKAHLHSDNCSIGLDQQALCDKSLLDGQALGMGDGENCNDATGNATIPAEFGPESIVNNHIDANIRVDPEEPVVKLDTSLKISEGCKADLCSGISLQAGCDVGMDQDNNGGDQHHQDMHNDVDVILGGHSTSSYAGNCTTPKLNETRSNQDSADRKEKLGNGHEEGSGILANSPSSQSFPEVCHDSQNIESGISHIEDLSVASLACSSSKLIERKHDCESDLHLLSETREKGLDSDSQVPSSTHENLRPASESVTSMQGNIQSFNKYFSSQGATELLNNVSGEGCHGVGLIVTGVGMLESSSGNSQTGNEVANIELKPISPEKNTEASGMTLEDGVHFPPQDGLTIEQLPSPNLEVKDCSEKSKALKVVSKDEKDTPNDSDPMVPETSLQQPTVVGSPTLAVSSKAQAEMNKISKEKPQELGSLSTCHDTTLKDSCVETEIPVTSEEDNTEAVYKEASLNVSEQIPNEGEMPAVAVPSFSKVSDLEDRQTILVAEEVSSEQISARRCLGNSLMATDGSRNAVCLPESDAKFSMLDDAHLCEEPGRPNCGSPSVISCVEIPQHEKELQEGDNQVVDQSCAPCGADAGNTRKACSVSTELRGNDLESDRCFTFEVTPLSERDAGKSSQLFTTIQEPQTSEVKVSKGSTLSQTDSKLDQESTPENSRNGAGSKSTDRKARRGSVRATAKEAKKGGRLQRSSTKTSSGTSSLPDLNTSASGMVFLQPFTDIQQLQLRAQIFVYGSLILGAAPDEACMITAFGASDGGRSIWDKAWRACVERSHVQRSHLSNLESSVPSRPGIRPDFGNKSPAVQNKATPNAVCRTSNKVSPSTVGNSAIAISSPLWGLSSPASDGLQRSSALSRGALLDYSQTLSPLHPYQTPPLRHFVGHTSWLPQAPFSAPWIAPSQTSALDTSHCCSSFPATETVHLTPIRESSLQHSSGIKHVSLNPVAQSEPRGSAIAGNNAPIGIKNGTESPSQYSADSKPRKRKKVPVSEGLCQIPLPQTDSTLATVVTSLTSASVATPTAAAMVSCIVPNSHEITRAFSVHANAKTGGEEAEHCITLSEETLCKVKEARLQAEEASASAAAAVSNSQGVWTELVKKRNCGLVPDIEATLASAAVAVAASAAIAKAAAAAAKIASNAALQAKLMADEALVAADNNNQSSGVSCSDGIGSASSIIVAAKEAARRRVEAASAAAKQAENVDALVRAAELVAEAVSQAGKVVAMGDHLSLSQVIEAGPGGCWKEQSSSDPITKSYCVKPDQVTVENCEKDPIDYAECSERPIEKTVIQNTSNAEPSITIGDLGQFGCSYLANTTEAIPDSELSTASVDAKSECRNTVDTSEEENIKAGSLVEVHKDNDGSAAWYLANVLSLEEGRACVSYTELPADDGLGHLQEWVPLDGGKDKAPIIRIARPVIVTRNEGTRKRQRDAMVDHICAVGDRVDAWIKDCWSEGVITEMQDEDGGACTVSLTARGGTSVVKPWHLRPSLVWVGGEWVKCSSSRVNNYSHEGDVHREKRARFSSSVETTGKEKMPKSDVTELGKRNDSTSLVLAADEKTFDIGKTSRDGTKSSSLRALQAGKKEGPGVIFGVPKPGKKRKFMDVSKHYIAGESRKHGQVNDSAKLVKASKLQGSSISSKFDLRGKQPGESKHNSGKVQNFSMRSVAQKNKSLTPASGDGILTVDLPSIQDSDSHNAERKHTMMGFGSFANTKGRAEGPFLFSAAARPPDGAPSKKTSTFNAKFERMSKGKAASSDIKMAKIEEGKVFAVDTSKSTPEVNEPRRSNRRIQPTSRLLEGLQSSLGTSKFPPISHDRANKSQQRNVSRGN